jgi:hypothetical protein
MKEVYDWVIASGDPVACAALALRGRKGAAKDASGNYLPENLSIVLQLHWKI